MLFTWPKSRNIVNILNAASILYISGVAAAIGFRMNLFNIGVEGQYRVAAFAAAAFAGAAWLPGKLNTVVAILVAMLAGAALGRHRRHPAHHARRQRGDLDDHAERDRALAGRLLPDQGRARRPATRAPTKTIAEGSWVGGITLFGDSPTKLFGLSLLAIVDRRRCSGVLLNRTRFGFDLRAAGASETGRGRQRRRT